MRCPVCGGRVIPRLDRPALAGVAWAWVRPATTVLTEARIAPAGHHVRHQDVRAVPSEEIREALR